MMARSLSLCSTALEGVISLDSLFEVCASGVIGLLMSLDVLFEFTNFSVEVFFFVVLLL